MKRSMYVLMAGLIFLSGISLSGCKKDEDEDENPVPSAEKDAYMFDVSADTEWDYWTVGKDGDQMFIMQANEMPTQVYLKVDNQFPGYTVFLNDAGRPDRALIQDHIFLFGNFNENMMDISVVLPDGEVTIIREVETAINWNNFTMKDFEEVEAWSDVIRWSGHVVSAVSCGVGYAAAVPTGGISLALAYVGCGAAVVGIASEFVPEDYPLVGLSASTIGNVATVVGCAQSLGIGCALDLSATALSETANAVQYFEEQEDEVRLAESLLFTGSGDVQVTLTWDNTSDLDLWVTDPSGEKIYYANSTSASGGELDFDDTDGFGPENIYWPLGEAPAGEYFCQVHYYSGTGTANYTVRIQAFGQVNQYEGSLNPDEVADIATFSSGKSFTINPIMKTKAFVKPEWMVK